MPTLPKTRRPHWLPEPLPKWHHPNRWKGYNSRRWRNQRVALLIAGKYKCAVEGCTRPATDMDHVIPIAQGGDPWDLRNRQILCGPHHRDKTNKERKALLCEAGEAKAEREGHGPSLI